jgi:hypothetical protein
MTLEGYIGPPLPQQAREFIAGWRAFRERFVSGLELPSLDDETEKQFLQLKTQILSRSRVIDLVSEGEWGLHNKIKGILNNLQSLDFFRQESVIFHDNMNNQWHDVFIQASKVGAIFQHKAEEEEQEG